MDVCRTLEILEALASGCSPATGEVVCDESVLNERDVIRALQMAIGHLKENVRVRANNVQICEEDIESAIQLFKGEGLNPTTNRLTGFFLGNRNFKKERLVSNELYGKYKDVYLKGQLLDFFDQHLPKDRLSNRDGQKGHPWKEVDHFLGETFNKLPERALDRLKERVEELGVLKTENLDAHVQNARIHHPRAYEAWTDPERELLYKALQYTNDLELLSVCFQRGKGSIRSYGKRLIYENQNLQDRGNEN